MAKMPLSPQQVHSGTDPFVSCLWVKFSSKNPLYIKKELRPYAIYSDIRAETSC